MYFNGFSLVEGGKKGSYDLWVSTTAWKWYTLQRQDLATVRHFV